MIFHFFYFNQCVVCIFGHKIIYKDTNLKVPFQELQRTAHLDYKVVFLYLWYHKDKSRLRKFEWLAGGENAWLSTARFKIETQCRCFYITVFLMETNCFQKILDVILLHIMSDKAAFVSGALFCLQRYRGNLNLSHSNSASHWQRINLHIFAATKR